MPAKTTLNTENPRLAAILEAVHETAKGLHQAGVMDQITMREFDRLCLPPVGPLAQEVTALRKEISALRRDLASPSFLVTGKAAINEFNKLSRVPHTQ